MYSDHLFTLPLLGHGIAHFSDPKKQYIIVYGWLYIPVYPSTSSPIISHSITSQYIIQSYPSISHYSLESDLNVIERHHGHHLWFELEQTKPFLVQVPYLE